MQPDEVMSPLLLSTAVDIISLGSSTCWGHQLVALSPIVEHWYQNRVVESNKQSPGSLNLEFLKAINFLGVASKFLLIAFSVTWERGT